MNSRPRGVDKYLVSLIGLLALIEGLVDRLYHNSQFTSNNQKAIIEMNVKKKKIDIKQNFILE